MATMFGRFEIQSELSKSDTALIYKAMDTEANQVVALKTQSLEPLGDGAEAFVERLIAEGESTRELAGQNIVVLYGAGEIDGQFCAAMEYIQGNSVATMLARKEGFSIWDLLDITRQVCAGLEQAAAKGVTHCSLEPAKIMVQWDGMVKILGYGISNMGLIGAESGKGLGRLMPYCSPEQIRGEAIDLRSNLFTLGAILYEMVAGRKAFDAADPAALVSRIENEMPASPSAMNSKIHPAVSALIMKALAKDPAERYQSARELLDDLEKCKENGSKKAAPDGKKAASAPNITVSSADRRAAASKFVSATSSTIDPPAGENKAAAAAASGGGFSGSSSSSYSSSSSFNATFDSGFASNSASNMDSNSGGRPIGDFEISAPESQAAFIPVQSAAVEQETERQSPRIAVDPMMSEPAAGSSGKSFSDLDELPPLKEPVFTPPVPEPAESLLPVAQISPRKEKEEKPKIQPREVAQKAIKEISTVPPRLMIYSILGAVGLILVVAIAIWVHVRSEDDGSTAAPRPAKAVASTPAQPAVPTPVAPQAEKAAPAVVPLVEDQPSVTVRQVEKRAPKNSRRVPAPAPVVTLGNALIDSSPQGAQFQVDGKSDLSWVTPFTVASLSPGKHIISVSKSGYSSEIRSVDVTAGATSSLTLRLASVTALVVVASTPPGAQVVLDGKPTGRVTPAQFAVEKGSHTVLLRKPGYLDETVTADLGAGQNFQYSPALRALGNAEDIRTVGKFKLFGRGGENAAGMGVISIHTQPKGAQIAINQRVLDKLSPVDLMLGPGNYVVDVTLTDFKPIHKVVSVDKGGKVAIDEILERQ
jgi:serine/threonine protein kinase